MAAARDDYSWVSRYPNPIDPATVPAHMRGNPLVERMLAMTVAEEAECEAAARRDEADDAETVALLLADAE